MSPYTNIVAVVKSAFWVGVVWTGLAASASAQTTTVEYVHTDALGSPVAMTNASGAVVERQVYEPYGAPVSHGPADGPGFTGHVEDSATGLIHMQQRYYEPSLGVFLSMDPISAMAGGFNRYQYANSSPYRYLDPDGRDARKPTRERNEIRERTTGSMRVGAKEGASRLQKNVVNGPSSSVAGTARPKGSAGPTKPVSGTVDVPSQDQYALEQVLGEPVGDVQVLENSPFAKLHDGAIATTRPGVIFLSGSGDDFLEDPRLMLEEYYHVTKQWNTGDATVIKYLIENSTNGNGYRGNRYEREAKGFAEEKWKEFDYIRGR